jgi:hypothetical protein
MSETSWTRGRLLHGGVEEFFGVLCPALSALSLMDDGARLAGAAALFLWLGWGHAMLFAFDLYPELRHRPFLRGLFAFGVGLGWPIWWAARRR